jgi:hypothetical protein
MNEMIGKVADQRERFWHSERQRIVVLTFDSSEEAQAWDAAGRPLHFLPTGPLVTVPYRQDQS